MNEKLTHVSNSGGWGGYDIYAWQDKTVRATYDTEAGTCILEMASDSGPWTEIGRPDIPTQEKEGETLPDDDAMEAAILRTLQETKRCH